MGRTDRTYNLGRLQQFEEKAKRIAVEIDAVVRALLYHFDPLDFDCQYVDKIDPWKLETYVGTIKTKVAELSKLRAEVVRLKAELGEEGA